MPAASRIIALATATIFGLAFAGLASTTVRAETPEWFTCPDSTAFDPRADRAPGALAARLHRPSAGAATSADLAAHARLSAMSYAMYDAFVAGGDPAATIAPRLRLIALIYGDPGPAERFRRQSARDTRTLYGFLADDAPSGRRLIVLRGTLQPNEWLRNIQAGLRPFVGSHFQGRFAEGAGLRTPALVHAGFLKIFASLEMTSMADGSRAPLADALPDIVAGRQTTFIGHSLGGALATLAGVEAARRSPLDAARIRVVTFASPRVGNSGFAALAQPIGRIDRVCNVVDLVPAVPPSTRLAPYIHVGEVFRISPFDWPDLENGHKEASRQVTCWHSIAAYAYMTDPAKSKEGLDGCLRGE